MPLRQFLLVKQGKNIGYAYRSRSIEAIRLYRKLEQELVTSHGIKDDFHGVHNLQPGTIQNADFLQSANICEGILDAVWGAVQKACSTTGKDSDTDNAFENLSNLLRGYNNESFALSLEGLEQAKRRDEDTSKLFAHFSAKHDRDKPIRFNKKKENHLFTLHYGKRTTLLELVVDYPPQVHALAWRLKKRCSIATQDIPLRHPHFYPDSFIEKLTEQLIGRPLGFLGGQTYGLTPRTGEWTPRIEVYGDDATGLNFKLESGGFSSTFRSTIKLENLKRVVFRDVFGQLVTRNAVENMVNTVGNPKEIKYSAWSSGMLLKDAVHTLEEIAEIPFPYTEVFSARRASTSLPQSQEPPGTRSPSQWTGLQPEPPSLDLLSSGPSLLSTIESALHITDPTGPHSGVANAGEPLPVLNRIEGIQVQKTTQEGPLQNGEPRIGSSKGRAFPSRPRLSPDANIRTRDLAGLILLPTNDEAWNQLSSPEELSHRSPQSNGGLTLPPVICEGHDSGYFSDGPSSPLEAVMSNPSIPAALSASRQEGNKPPPAPFAPSLPTSIPKGIVEGTNGFPVLPQRSTTDSMARPGVHGDFSTSGPNSSFRRGAGSIRPDAIALPAGPSKRSARPLPVPPTVLTDQARREPPHTMLDKKPQTAPNFPRRLVPKGEGPKKMGIAAGITIASHNVVSVLPTASEAFPEAKIEKKKPESWVHKHLVKPVQHMVQKTFQ